MGVLGCRGITLPGRFRCPRSVPPPRAVRRLPRTGPPRTLADCRASPSPAPVSWGGRTTRGGSVEIEEVLVARAADGVVAAGDAELPQDAADVGAHGVDRDEERS